MRRTTSYLRTLFAAFASSAVATLAFAQPADRIWTGGPIITINDKMPRAEAVAERGGRIVAVGKRAEVLKLRGPSTQFIDLQGRTLLPGFFDAHGHVTLGGLQALSANLLAPPDGDVKDMASLLKTLREWVAANEAAVKKVNLIVGFGYDNSTLAERRHPTRDDLDQISRDIPILLVHQSAHLAALNSKALEVAGITAETPDPAGGVIRRKAGSKEPDGVLEETAMQAAALKLLSQVGPDGVKTFAKAGAELWARFGYTTGQDGGSTPGTVAVLRQVAAAGDLKIDVVAYPLLAIDRDFIKANASREYANRFRVAGGKILIDGSPQGFTAWRDRPYYKPVGNYPPGYSGYPSTMPEDVVSQLTWAYANDVQVQTHSNGEAASDALIAGLTVAQLTHAGQEPAAGAHPWAVPARGPGRCVQAAGCGAVAVPDAHVLLGRVAPQPDGGAGARSEHLADRLGAQARHDLHVASRRAGRVPGFDAGARCDRHAACAWHGPRRRPRAPGGRHDGAEGDDDLARLPALRGRSQGLDRGGQARRLRDPVKDPTKVPTTTLADIKVTETIKEGATVFRLTPPAKLAASLSSGTDRRGENGFSRFLTQMALYQDVSNLPPYLQQPGTLAYFESAPHDKACVTRAMDRIMAAMLEGSAAR